MIVTIETRDYGKIEIDTEGAAYFYHDDTCGKVTQGYFDNEFNIQNIHGVIFKLTLASLRGQFHTLEVARFSQIGKTITIDR